MIIALEGLEFFAYHGFYAEEQKVGNRYGVDIQVFTAEESATNSDVLAETINYERLYEIIKTEMILSSKLLEHVAARIADKVLAKYQDVEKVQVTVRKFNPPIGGICRSAAILLERARV